DTIGARFRNALAERAKSGVAVRVVYDSLGSLGMTEAFWAPLTIAGGEVREFHSILPIDPTFRWEHLERRDHRKLLVVDGNRGFTGGMNLGAEWLPVSEGGGGWRDDMVEARGPVAQEMRTLFYQTWRRVSRVFPPRDVSPLPRRRTRSVWVL